MAVEKNVIIGTRGSLEVFRTEVSQPTPALSIPPFPPNLSSLPIPQTPDLPKPDVAIQQGTSKYNGTTKPFPTPTTPSVPTPALGTPPFPPNLSSLPVPKVPEVPAPDVVVSQNNNLNAPNDVPLPSVTKPEVPTPALGTPPFPPNLSSLPVPALPAIPALPDLAVKSLSLPYMELPLPDGGDAMASPLTIKNG